MIEWMEKWQALLYIAALIVGATLGLLVPAAENLDILVTPILMVLLYATFLGIPLVKRESVWDGRFIAAILTFNFLVVPAVVFALSRFVVGHDQLLMGVLLVLLAPCIDYVVVFSGLAGAAHDKLLAATPLLMLGQMIALPFYLSLFAGSATVGALELWPLVEAFILIIVLPLLLAWGTQALNTKAARTVQARASNSMVPLMMITLAVVVASQMNGVREDLGSIAAVIPIYIAFLVLMVPVGIMVGKLFKLAVPELRAAVFSGATRNSLVVLPLALVMPSGFELVPSVVVAQTLVELVGMVIFLRLIPWLVKDRRSEGV